MQNILVLSGFDPTAGAGILRDSITINSTGNNPCGVITVNTVQNTKKFTGNYVVNEVLLTKQLELLTSDIKIDAIKIGLIHQNNITPIINVLKKLGKKVVLDPIIHSSTFESIGCIKAINAIMPYSYIITPNVLELQILSGEKDLGQAIKKIDVEYVLLTATDVSDKIITHKLYHNKRLIKKFEFKKLANNYHGSGCTLSSLIATKINENMVNCCKYALNKTYESLKNGVQIGKSQMHPKL